MSVPEPLMVKVPLLKLALPATPTAPTSASVQPAGNVPPDGLTVKLTVVVWVKVPSVPVMVMVAPPVVAVPLAPRGKTDADRFAVPLKALISDTEMVLVVLWACVTVTLDGAADNEKAGAGVTVRLMAALWLMLPDVAVTVSG